MTNSLAAQDKAWTNLVKAAKAWGAYLDQWDKFKFETNDGPIYVTISREDPYPDSFEEVL